MMSSTTTNSHKIVPKYGLKLNLDHVYPEKRNQKYIPSLRVIWSMLPFFFRYILFYIKTKWKGQKLFIDGFSTRTPEQIYGVPIGGIGGGTIGRGFKGEFCRFQLRPGIYEWNTVDANQFIVTIKDEKNVTTFQSLLSTFRKSSLSCWENLLDGSNCSYTGLYPRAWTEYDLSKYGIKLTCRQISPVIPHDYKNSSLPCAIFVWNIENTSDSYKTVTITFTFKNGTGSKQDKNAVCSSETFSCTNSEGLILYSKIDNNPCAYALAAKSRDHLNVTKCLYFHPKSDGFDVWKQLKDNGEFDKPNRSVIDNVYGEMACGIAAKIQIGPKESQEVEMSLVWDMPTINFPMNKKTYNRFYTKYFGKENALPKIISYAFDNYPLWEEAIYNWQRPILEDSKLPDWYKGALFNETYFISDGGSLWLLVDEEEAKTFSKNDPRIKYGRFAYLEGHEYIMYNSYDVHFYASHALHKNWPFLQKCIQYDLRDFIALEIKDPVKELFDGRRAERKYPNSVPHDAGKPDEDPLSLINAYPVHDVSSWRDLNSKFILQTYRDAYCSYEKPDIDYLRDMYDFCYSIIQIWIKKDLDEDGLIVNGGVPDQTYDSWNMTGVSAYCGGLWLAALQAMVLMADQLGKGGDKKLYEDILNKAKPAFERKLWNGSYYNFDCSKQQCKSLMADQLCGHWYLRCSGINNYEVFPKENVKIALNNIFKNNVGLFCNGTMGAVNGTVDGKVDNCTVQSQEVWTGVTYALASTMISEGMIEEGFKTAGGMYNSMVYKLGLAFDTPEALYAEKYMRAVAYMRPLSIWSMQIAWENFAKSLE